MLLEDCKKQPGFLEKEKAKEETDEIKKTIQEVMDKRIKEIDQENTQKIIKKTRPYKRKKK